MEGANTLLYGRMAQRSDGGKSDASSFTDSLFPGTLWHQASRETKRSRSYQGETDIDIYTNTTVDSGTKFTCSGELATPSHAYEW